MRIVRLSINRWRNLPQTPAGPATQLLPGDNFLPHDGFTETGVGPPPRDPVARPAHMARTILWYDGHYGRFVLNDEIAALASVRQCR